MPQTQTIVFYGLSTCPYCRRAKEYMDSKQVAFELHYVDKLEGEERDKTVEKVRAYNPALSFPTIVVFTDNKDPKVFVGFTDEAKAIVDAIAA
ncbi:glutaredoxin [Desulfovibrio sp. OttesenSCG-928-F07]|nr:glutaredoxin [Desulfovibrio sp. OttesenSCG-928-F07]